MKFTVSTGSDKKPGNFPSSSPSELKGPTRGGEKDEEETTTVYTCRTGEAQWALGILAVIGPLSEWRWPGGTSRGCPQCSAAGKGRSVWGAFLNLRQSPVF